VQGIIRADAPVIPFHLKILSKKILSKKILSKKILSKKILPKKILPKKILSKKILSKKILPKKILSVRPGKFEKKPYGATSGVIIHLTCHEPCSSSS
jgi:hypothetical protein